MRERNDAPERGGTGGRPKVSPPGGDVFVSLARKQKRSREEVAA
jgi:hypothetical protein